MRGGEGDENRASFPTHSAKSAEWMGHPDEFPTLAQKQERGEDGAPRRVSHPSRKNKNAARMGHPDEFPTLAAKTKTRRGWGTQAGFPQKRRFPTGCAGLQLCGRAAILDELQQDGNGRMSVSLAIEGGVCYSWIVVNEM